MGTLHEDLWTFLKVCGWIFLSIRNISDKIPSPFGLHTQI